MTFLKKLLASFAEYLALFVCEVLKDVPIYFDLTDPEDGDKVKWSIGDWFCCYIHTWLLNTKWFQRWMYYGKL